MKTYIILITFLISNLALFAQAPKYQTYSADLLIIASKDGENIQWKNKDIVVTLNYKTGALKIIINNNDFFNKQNNENIIDDDSENSDFIFLGNLPIDQVINQKSENQEYDIELQLTNNNFSINEVINFKMNIMRPNQTAESYRVFTFTGILYNDELKLPAFEGYNNDIEIRIFFNAFWNGR